MFFVVFHR